MIIDEIIYALAGAAVVNVVHGRDALPFFCIYCVCAILTHAALRAIEELY